MAGKSPKNTAFLVDVPATFDHRRVSYYYYVYLVGGIPSPLKNEFVSWDDYSQYGKIKNVPNHQPDTIVY
jgi:hypothetical protein